MARFTRLDKRFATRRRAATSLVRSASVLAWSESGSDALRPAGRYLTLITRALQRLHSIDGTLGGAAALVDLHHTAFSAESAVLPSGAVTPVGYQNPADLSRLTEANGGAQYWGGTVTPRNGAAAGGGGAELPAAPATGEIDMWLDNELLGHSFDSWFDIPQFTTAAAASGS